MTHLETTSVETLDDCLAMLDGVGSQHLQVMLDTGHANVTARKLGEVPAAYLQRNVEVLGRRLRHIHLSDNFGDLDAHLLPGEGDFDFADAYAALKAANYQGVLSAEIMMFGANRCRRHRRSCSRGRGPSACAFGTSDLNLAV